MPRLVDITNALDSEMEQTKLQPESTVKEKKSSTSKTNSPVASRTRRSNGGVSPRSHSISSRRRRSSIRRKSLVETLRSVADCMTDSSNSASSRSENVTESTNPSTKSVAVTVSDPSPINPEASSSSEIVPDTSENELEKYGDEGRFILRRCSALQNEATKWTRLLQTYKDAEAKPDELLRNNETVAATPIACSRSTLDYDAVASTIEKLDQRLVKAVKVISRSVNIMQTVIDQQNKTSGTSQEMAADTPASDPRELLRKLISLDNLHKSSSESELVS